MFKGFYNLTSAMLTHQQNLNVIANNMINVSTAGYKQDRYTASTFDEVMYSRVGNKYNRGEEIGRQSYIRAASDIYTDHTQGTLEPTGLPLDFAINGDGFFAWVVNADGNAEMRPLNVAGQISQQFQIASGVKPGERAITDGAQRVQPGVAVQILN